MATVTELRTRGEALARGLQALDADLTTARKQLQNAVSDLNMEPGAAAVIAARVNVLEARRTAAAAEIEQNAQQVQRAMDLLSSKEHKAEQKRITEIETFLASEAAAIRDLQAKMRTRLQGIREKYGELYALIEKSPAMDAAEKISRKHNADYMYLLDVSQPIEQQAAREAMAENLRNPPKSIDGAGAKNARKAPAYFTPNGDPLPPAAQHVGTSEYFTPNRGQG